VLTKIEIPCTRIVLAPNYREYLNDATQTDAMFGRHSIMQCCHRCFCRCAR